MVELNELNWNQLSHTENCILVFLVKTAVSLEIYRLANFLTLM